MILELTKEELDIMKFVFKNAIDGLNQLRVITMENNPQDAPSLDNTIRNIKEVYDNKIKNQ
jgi:hypothetical protein